ncbi:MAG TPA: DUF4097 family beta strand repeat-containing protein [Candidatus Acidoferrum sp.]|nr:DUF4097 family beta strand repeat-containing protein [Candidatus Acidoferrum sp.]
MAPGRTRGGGIFTGLVLLAVGALLLLHNYRGLELGDVLIRWWPLLLIFLGLIKLYERFAAGRAGDPSSARVTGGEIVLVIAMIALLSGVVAVDYLRQNLSGHIPAEFAGDAYPFDLDVAPMSVPANSRIMIQGGRGVITVRPADSSEIRVSGKKNVHAWSESDAQRRAGPVSVGIVQTADGYTIQPSGVSPNDGRISVDMDVQVPKNSILTVKNQRGDITVSDMAMPVSVTTNHGDVEVRDSGGDVNVEMHQGDVKVSDTKGNIKISGNGGEVDVTSATGSFTLDGEFYGPIRADKIAKGVRFISQRTDMTLTALTGHMEASSGNLEIADAPGDITLRTNRYSVSIENASGKMDVANRDGDVSLQFSAPPKQDITVTDSNASVSVTLPGASNFGVQADCHSCDVDSEFTGDNLKKTSNNSGDSHFEGRYGSERGPKISLRTSYGSINIRKTS